MVATWEIYVNQKSLTQPSPHSATFVISTILTSPFFLGEISPENEKKKVSVTPVC
jgi:hypothetical protein